MGQDLLIYIASIGAAVFAGCPVSDAVLAQSVARRLGKAEVGGSSPLDSFYSGITLQLRRVFFYSIGFCEERSVNMEIRTILGDITKVKCDAIVNAANTSLLGGGGVDGAIHRAAGPGLLEECRKLHGCETGQAKITGGYNLPATYVIHTPGPIWRGGGCNEAQLLAGSYRSCLELAEAHGCASVAFPSISTGVYHFPLEEASRIAVETIKEFSKRAEAVREVILVAFDSRTKEHYDRALKQHFPENA